jgi:hypothetical protein
VTRALELTALVLEGAATPEEEEELAGLLADPETQRAQLLFLEVEATLRGLHCPPDQAARVLERINRERADRVVRGVMSQVQTMSARPPRRRARRLWPVGLALISATALAASVALVRQGRRADAPTPGEPAARRAAPRAAAPAPAPARRPVVIQPPSSEPEVLFRYDFEDGVLPEGFIEGHVVPSPCPVASRGCALGTISPYGAETSTVAIERYPQLLHHAPGLVISFDYWAGADAPELAVMTWAPAKRQNYTHIFDSFPRERWSHAEVRLTDLVGNRRRDRLEEGDRISNILIMAGRTGGKPLYIDNLTVFSHSIGVPPTGTQPLP